VAGGLFVLGVTFAATPRPVTKVAPAAFDIPEVSAESVEHLEQNPGAGSASAASSNRARLAVIERRPSPGYATFFLFEEFQAFRMMPGGE
jgi:hypothetical protein